MVSALTTAFLAMIIVGMRVTAGASVGAKQRWSGVVGAREGVIQD